MVYLEFFIQPSPENKAKDQSQRSETLPQPHLPPLIFPAGLHPGARLAPQPAAPGRPDPASSVHPHLPPPPAGHLCLANLRDQAASKDEEKRMQRRQQTERQEDETLIRFWDLPRLLTDHPLRHGAHHRTRQQSTTTQAVAQQGIIYDLERTLMTPVTLMTA